MPVELQIALPAPDNDDEFEVLVEHSLKARHHNPHLTRYGRGGQAQHGIDGWDPLEPGGLVWQATLQREKLLDKLEHDLELFDRGPHHARAPFIFVVAVPRDAALQLAVNELCQRRLEAKKSPVTVVFWIDLQRHLPALVRQAHYPQHSWSAPVPAISTGFAAIGASVIVEARLIGQRHDEWALELGEYTQGGPSELAALIESFDNVPSHERYIVFEGLGVARWLEAAPTWDGKTLRASVAPRPPRENIDKVGAQLPLTEDGDLSLDRDVISGFSAALQKMNVTMSFRLGEWFQDRRLGTRCAEYFRQGHTAAVLGRLFALELARVSSLAIGKDGAALPFIERVVGVEVASLEPKKGCLLAESHVVFCGFGEWRGPLRVHVSADAESERESR